MRKIACLLSVALGACVVSTPGAEAQSTRPQFRPAVITSKPESLVNRINTQAVFKAGQKDGAVMFSCVVKKDGQTSQSRTYRPTPDSTALEEEVRKQLPGAKFAPAIYNHEPVEVVVSGTVVFWVSEEQPRLQIFLNQDPNELKDMADFIAPQPVLGVGSPFAGFQYPGSIQIQVAALVDLRMKMDQKGTLLELQAVNEDPPNLGFGPAAEAALRGAKFIPAFRAGDAWEADLGYTVSYQPVGAAPAPAR